MNSDFHSDREVLAAEVPRAELVDPEAFDATEQQFAASLDAEASDESVPLPAIADATEPGDPTALPAQEGSVLSSSNEAQPSWRKEISERVSKYRLKSPREPRYPSLQLKFESMQPSWTAPPRNAAPASRDSVAFEREIAFEAPATQQPHFDHPEPARHEPEIIDNLIEFPRFTLEPVSRPDELAEPVQDRLRIIEAPEVTTAPPALGGILMEPVEEHEPQRRPGFDVPLQSSSLSRRFAATFVDAVIVAAAISLFGYIFLRLASPALPPLRLAIIGVPLAALFWLAYQYLFLVHTGSTPGLRITKLSLSRFDGSSAPRSLRRWRVIASVLSTVSLGLGYLWCFLDEDQLCWHDRITRTHLAPNNQHKTDIPN